MYKIINRKKRLAVRTVDIIAGPVFMLYAWVRKLIFRTSSYPESPPVNILVVRFGYIGDLILTLPVFPLLRERFPEANITLLTAIKAAPLVKNNPYIDRILLYEAPWLYRGGLIRMLVDYIFFISALRKERFDVGIDMRSDIRNIFFILFLGGIKRRIAYDFGGGHYLLTDAIPYQHLQHKIDLHVDMVRYLGCRARRIEMDLYVSDSEKLEAEGLLSGICLTERPLFFAIHPGARAILKRWDLDKYTELARHLTKRYPCCILLLGEKSDSKAFEPIIQKGGDFVFSFVGKLDLRQLAAVVERSSLLICNDSAPMHIGVAVKTPTLTIFGPSKSMETGPYFYGHRVLEKNFLCRYTCDETRCLYKEYRACLHAISVEDVLEAVHELVQKNNIHKDVA